MAGTPPALAARWGRNPWDVQNRCPCGRYRRRWRCEAQPASTLPRICCLATVPTEAKCIGTVGWGRTATARRGAARGCERLGRSTSAPLCSTRGTASGNCAAGLPAKLCYASAQDLCCCCKPTRTPQLAGRQLAGRSTVSDSGIPFATSVISETAAGFSAEDLKRAEAQWREQGSPKGLTSY